MSNFSSNEGCRPKSLEAYGGYASVSLNNKCNSAIHYSGNMLLLYEIHT